MAHVHKLYEYDYEKNTIRLKNKVCPRCKSIMAHHLKPVERWHCGKCGYTEFVTVRTTRRTRARKPGF